MPTVFRQDGFRFFFYSNEGSPREPAHIHVIRGGAEANVWLWPRIAVATSAGFDARTLGEISAIVAANRNLIEKAWHDHFG